MGCITEGEIRPGVDLCEFSIAQLEARSGIPQQNDNIRGGCLQNNIAQRGADLVLDHDIRGNDRHIAQLRFDDRAGGLLENADAIPVRVGVDHQITRR